MAYTTLISAGQLASLNTHKNSQPLTIFDCSFDLTQPAAGYKHYLASHIPGALYARLDAAMSSDSALAASGGRHPLPTRETFAAWLASAGVLQNAQIVVYDRNGANYCGRLWWMLKWLGHMDVAVLDGGLQAWTAHGGAVASGLPAPARRFGQRCVRSQAIALPTGCGRPGGVTHRTKQPDPDRRTG